MWTAEGDIFLVGFISISGFLIIIIYFEYLGHYEDVDDEEYDDDDDDDDEDDDDDDDDDEDPDEEEREFLAALEEAVANRIVQAPPFLRDCD